MSQIDTNTLTRYFNMGEGNVSQDIPFLIDRKSLTITAGTGVYLLSDYTIDIRRVTWLGMKLDPLPERNKREVFQSAPQQGRPFWYIYNNIGECNIQLFPTPNQSLAAVSDPWKDISTGCIVEFARTTDNTDFIIPSWCRNRLLKQFVAMKAAQLEGSNQSLKLMGYYDKKWKLLVEKFRGIIDDLHVAPRKLIINDISNSYMYPASPVLPIDKFGIGVDEGY